MVKPRNYFIDEVKGFTILGVVAIHFLAALGSSRYWWLQIFLRFAVPVFVGISGYLLTGSFERSNGNVRSFYKKRVLNLLPLYILWTAAFYVFFKNLPGWSNYYADKPWWLVWFLGAADYHLYFVPMILCLYCLFPLLYKCLKQSWWVLVLVGLVQAALYLFIESYPTTQFLYTDQFYYRIFLSWLWYFCLGIFVAISPKLISKFPLKVTYLLIFSGLAAAIIRGLFLMNGGSDVILATLTTTVPVMIYSSGILMYIFTSQKESSQTFFSAVGKNSYLIFLSHTMLIWIIQARLHGAYVGLPLAVFLGFLGISMIVQKWQAR